MKITLTLFTFLFSTLLMAQNSKLPIIDMHLHAGAVEKNHQLLTRVQEARLPLMIAEIEIAGQVKEDDSLRQRVVTLMDEFNIVTAFLSDQPDDVFEWVDAVHGRFIASPMVYDPADADLVRLRREYEAGRFGGMGEIASQYSGIAADDPVLEPIFALAEEFDVPVLIHLHGGGAPAADFRIAIGRPTRLEEVLVRHPTLRIYLEKSGFPFLAETIALMYRYPNVYGDLSWHNRPREIWEWYLRRLLDAGLGKRLMFGSDATPSRPQLISQNVEAINSAEFLSDEQKRDIFYNNAARFLRLSDEEIAKHHKN